MSILTEAHEITSGDRNSSYGDFVEDYARTVALFKLVTGHDLTPAEGIAFMQCVKLSRLGHGLQGDLPPEKLRDSLVDLAGYTRGVAQALGVDE